MRTLIAFDGETVLTIPDAWTSWLHGGMWYWRNGTVFWCGPPLDVSRSYCFDAEKQRWR